MTSGHSRYQEKHVNGWNFLVHWRELAKVFRLRNVCFDEQRSTPPITVEVDPVDYCNHSCTWCFTSSHRETDRLSKAEVHKITEELGEMGAKSVHFAGGGEPTLFRGFALQRRRRP